LLTFDDGWRDNYVYAFPVLRKYDTPALIFLTVDYIGSNRIFWPEQVIHTLTERPSGFRRFQHTLRHLPQASISAGLISRLLKTDRPDHRILTELIEELKPLDQQTREELLSAPDIASGEYSDDEDKRVMLNWSEIAEMSADVFSLGSHGLTHELLLSLDRSQIREEITESKRIIEEKTGHVVSAFAYPNGDFSSEICGEVESAGYDCAFTTRKGRVTRESNRYTLERINIHEEISRGLTGGFSRPRFVCHLLGKRV
jgi:peptidoglycan/xylan/chitin deacetylase (PgdA/CDA1 family)